MDHQEHLENPLHGESHYGRRVFLARMCAGAVATPSAFAVGADRAGRDYDPCKASASAADTLILYLDLLNDVQFLSVKDVYDAAIATLKACEDVFNEIYKEVEALAKELRKSKHQAEVKDIRSLVEAGKANLRLAKSYVGVSGNIAHTSFATLALLTEQVGKKAEDIPDGPILLSAEATTILKRIISLVRDFKSSQAAASAAQATHQDALTPIYNKIKVIRDLMVQASVYITDADNTVKAEASDLRHKASASIEEAISKLRAITQAKPDQPTVVLPRDRLIYLLKATDNWIIDPTLVTISYGINSGQARFVMVSNRRGLPVFYDDQQRVSDALSAHCKTGSWLRTLWCISIVAPIWILAKTAEERSPLIKDVLDTLFKCPAGGSKQALADELSKIRL